MPYNEGITKQGAPDTRPAPRTCCRAAEILAEEQKEALKVPLTFVTPRSIFIGIRTELTLGALETILAGARPVATKAICALRAKAGPRGR